MSTGEKDTPPEAARSTEAATEAAAATTYGATTIRESPAEGDRASEDESAVSSDEAARMDAVLRSLAKRRVPVPNSIEPGASYYVEHAPRPGHTEPAPREAVLIERPKSESDTTDSRARTTVPRRRSDRRRTAAIGAAAAGACLLAGLVFVALRPDRSRLRANRRRRRCRGSP